MMVAEKLHFVDFLSYNYARTESPILATFSKGQSLTSILQNYMMEVFYEQTGNHVLSCMVFLNTPSLLKLQN